MKGTIQPDHMPVNKYELSVIGLPSFTFTTISGIEEELEVVDLPDRTRATGGTKKAGEFTATLPAHHSAEQAAMEIWYREGQDPVLPTYKKPGTLSLKSISGGVRSFSLMGLFPRKRKLPDLDMKNEGEPGMIEWTISFDDILPI